MNFDIQRVSDYFIVVIVIVAIMYAYLLKRVWGNLTAETQFEPCTARHKTLLQLPIFAKSLKTQARCTTLC